MKDDTIEWNGGMVVVEESRIFLHPDHKTPFQLQHVMGWMSIWIMAN
jgi:hypothetical protein